ncbi:hypothetical protein [Methanoculleus chikugoensis]|uniref:hypothetical protein n=1 Tax=Methanoculleus chikugoensis TaxID=118126 RepID=UPI000B06E2B3|nr:hypothetical protein [Methanoculleus chikugoensis]
MLVPPCHPQTHPPADVARRDQIVVLVEKMLDLNRRLAAAKAPAREGGARRDDRRDRPADR